MKKSSVTKKLIYIIIGALFIFQITPQIVAATSTTDGYQYTVSGTEATITGYSGTGGDITIPETVSDGMNTYLVTGIGDRAFERCTNLRSVIIPDSVTSIGSYAFCACDVVMSVTLGNNVTTIGDYAFATCYWLMDMVIPDSVTSIGYGAFNYCNSLTGIEVSSKNTAYSSIDGILYDKLKTILIRYPTGKADLLFTVPNSVDIIGDYAFNNCDKLTNITIPNSVTTIGDYSFAGCGLTKMIIPDSVTTIGKFAFGGCHDMRNVTVGNSVTSIGSQAFSMCDRLTSVTIPNSVISIGDSAFDRCTRLKNVIIGNGVIDIGSYAFRQCRDLTEAKFFGNAPTINNSIFFYCSSNFKAYYLDGKTGFTNPWYGYQTEPFYIVTYNNNRSTSGEVPIDNGTYIQGSTITVLDNTGTLTKTGYTFAGWNTEADGSGKDYASGESFAMGTEHVTLYSKWTMSRDINHDGIIDIIDIAELASHFNEKNGQINWDVIYDLNQDGIVDIYDIVLVSKSINTQ